MAMYDIRGIMTADDDAAAFALVAELNELMLEKLGEAAIAFDITPFSGEDDQWIERVELFADIQFADEDKINRSIDDIS